MTGESATLHTYAAKPMDCLVIGVILAFAKPSGFSLPSINFATYKQERMSTTTIPKVEQ